MVTQHASRQVDGRQNRVSEQVTERFVTGNKPERNPDKYISALNSVKPDLNQ